MTCPKCKTKLVPKSCPDLAYPTGKAMNVIDLPDAIRAYRDRPSMEAELTALRAKCQRYEAALKSTALAAAIRFRGVCGCEDCPPEWQQIENIRAEFNEWWDARAALNEKGD